MKIGIIGCGLIGNKKLIQLKKAIPLVMSMISTKKEQKNYQLIQEQK